MSRSFLLGAGAMCWTAAGVVALDHVLRGDLFIPAGMAAAAVVWVAVRLGPLVIRRPVPAEVDVAA